jgi:hypothetical protein
MITKVGPSHFSPELIALMKAALDKAVRQLAIHTERRYETKDGGSNC